ncbi:F10 [Felid gammaherpesvirus 1]|uniref:F10 n=1 Tax=Felid gammaherpesvirus 1 TaxID=2560468 RepID=A0A0M3T9C3_9GAMA|nr:F10 [Felis catus gammaherpesvirus 1]ALE14716.1 F10 [Felis catus gammaherpesvirus 1]
MLDTVICRICMCNIAVDNKCSPCNCKGTLAFVHQVCLKSWIQVSQQTKCNICDTCYNFKWLPFLEWTLPEIDYIEKDLLKSVCLGFGVMVILCLAVAIILICIFATPIIHVFWQLFYIFCLVLCFMYMVIVYRVVIYDDLMIIFAVFKWHNTQVA